MLLTEIIDTQKTRKVSRLINPRGEPIGEPGATATAYYDEKTNTVSKVVAVEDRHDPYVRFVRLIQKYDDNPFMPRIYNAKLYKDKEDDSMIFFVQMEKLVPIDHPKVKDSVLHIMKNQLGFDINNIDIVDDRENVDDFTQMDFFRFLSKMKFTEGRQKLRKKTNNPKFAEALSILTKVFQSSQGRPDIHGDNLMVRLTSTGPQLVIIDPIAPNWV